jgi:integral membrane protein
VKRTVRAYLNFKPFTEDEAWLIFKIAAFAEAIGWTILIIGIMLTEHVFGGNRIPVVLAGRTHGIFFMLYIVATLSLAPSLGWKWKQTISAGLMSVPPYGTIAAEVWFSHRRKRQGFNHLSSIIRYQQLSKTFI